MKNYKYIIGAWAMSLIGLASCETDDLTGDSAITPTNPTATIQVAAQNFNFVEQDSSILFSVTLSEPQIVDVTLTAITVEGTATEGVDYDLTSVTIPAGKLSGAGEITVYGDDEIEETETVTIQLGTESRDANVQIDPVTLEFTLINYSEDDLIVDLSWSSDGEVIGVDGEAISATNLADLRLLLKDSDGAIVASADGGAFETAVLDSELPDGEYTIVTDYYSAYDLGDQGGFTLSLDVTTTVLGVSSSSLSFPGALTSQIYVDCPNADLELATITKSGTNYSVSNTVGFEGAELGVAYAGTYNCNEPGYGDYEVTFSEGTCPGSLVIDNFWDYGIVVTYVLSPDGSVDLPAQETEASDGTPVLVEGSGVYSETATEKTLIVDYTVRDPASGGLYDDNTHTFTMTIE